MNVERVLLEEFDQVTINIGYQGEKNHTKVIISCPVMFRNYPDAVASMVVKPPQGDLYPVSLTRSGNDLIWDVSEGDVANSGSGTLQLTFTDGEGDDAEVIKTVYGAYSVNASLVATGEAPDPVQSWLDEAGAALATFETEVGEIRKITTATAEDEGKALSPKTVVNGKVTEWEYIDTADPEAIQEAVDNWLDDHPEATTTVEDGAITEAKLNDSLKEDLAWQDDVDELKSAIKRPEFIVGNAEEVLSDRGESDKAVYLFRKTGGNAKAYNREKVRKLVGGTVAWNQLIEVPSSSQSKTQNGVIIVDNRDGTYTVSSEAGGATADTYIVLPSSVPVIAGHKYYYRGTPSGGSNSTYYSYAINALIISIGNDYGNGVFGSPHTDGNLSIVGLLIKSGTVITTPIVFKPQLFDLTAALGSTIADHLYTLETATPGAGVALFRSLFDKSYYAYNAGSLESVNVSEHRCVGFNQWDEQWEVGKYNVANGTKISASNGIRSKNKIRILPSTSYYTKCESHQTSGDGVLLWYDLNDNYIGYETSVLNTTKVSPANAAYCAFYISPETTYHNDICINLSNAAKNGQYEPYQLSTYSMPNVTLRGIPKLVNNEIVFDGDELTPDGTVKRRYALVDLSTLAWSYSSGESAWYNTTLKQTGKFAYNNVTWISDKWNAHVWTGRTEGDIVCDGSSNVYCKTSDTVNSPTGYLVYELTTPTTESADPYQELQVCNRYGTEKYIDRLATAETSPRDVAIPAGHQTFYPVNVFDYIDELTKPDNNFIADANIQSGKYFSVGNGLYISTQAIAQGETIIPGTNCTAVSLADALNAINQ